MSAEYVPIRLDLPDDVDVVTLAARLGVSDVDLVVGKLVRFWTWASRNSTDGELRGMTPEALDGLLRLPGFAEGLLAVKPEPWLIKVKGGLRIPRWDRWLSASAKARAGETIRKRLQRREEGASEPNKPPNKCPDKIPDRPPDKSGTTLGQKRDQRGRGREENSSSRFPESAVAASVDAAPRPKGAAAAAGKSRGPAGGGVWKLLESAGVGEPVRTELAEAGLSALEVQATIASCKAKGKGVGVLVLELRGLMGAAERRRKVHAALEVYHGLGEQERATTVRWFREFMAGKGRDFSRVTVESIVASKTFGEYLVDEVNLTDGSMNQHASA